MKSKTIILSSPDGKSTGRAILTLTMDDELLKCKIRLYNMAKLNRYTKIGVYHQEQVYSANLIERNGCYESSLVGDFNMDADFYTALIQTDKNNEALLAGGTYAGFYFNDNSVFNENGIKDYNEDKIETEAINDELCEENSCNQCEHCKYKEYFFAHAQDDDKENNTPQISPTPDEKVEDVNSIINDILPQFEYIFENYSADQELNNLIPNSKFVQINETNEHYSIGAIYERDELKYICYAVKTEYNKPAPIEIGKYYQWLPLDNEDPLSDGYYIVFQDAKDLKIVEI